MKLYKKITHQVVISIPNSSLLPKDKRQKAAYIGVTGTEKLSNNEVKEKIIKGLKNVGILDEQKI